MGFFSSDKRHPSPVRGLPSDTGVKKSKKKIRKTKTVETTTGPQTVVYYEIVDD